MPQTYTIQANTKTFDQASSRKRDSGASFAARKGHIPQLSISDDNHHVTETIGYMYGDDNDQDTRQNSTYRTSIRGDPSEGGDGINIRRLSPQRKALPEIRMTNGNTFQPNGQRVPLPDRGYSWEHEHGDHSPTSLTQRERSGSETATSPFPLNDIDYESSPAAVAQELSNLQALRRMSMDVAAAGDPDLPQLNPATLPSAPSHESSEDDSSRLFWVPARLHPELAPTEFKSFLDSKTEQINRRSGELSSFGLSKTSRSSSLSAGDGSGLRRKKSMLSRQINSSVGYQDGAERLERKKSLSRRNEPSDPNLAELESLVSKNLHIERPESPEDSGDIILPSVPGSSLKRSTRTKYQRGGSLKSRGDRTTFAARAAKKVGGPETYVSPVTLTHDVPVMPLFSSQSELDDLAGTLRDPSAERESSADDFSRRTTRSPSPPLTTTIHSGSTAVDPSSTKKVVRSRESAQPTPELRQSRGKSPRLPNAGFEQQNVPQIVETPPVEDSPRKKQPVVPSQPLIYNPPPPQPQPRHPERTSSREAKALPAQRPTMPRTQSSASLITNRPPSRGQVPQHIPKQSLEQPSLLPGNDTNTGNLSFIPTLTIDKKSEARKKDESKKSSWGWLLGKEEAEREKDKSKVKASKTPQSHDNTRLDLLQTSIDGSSRRRETIELDRDSLKLEEERKKESQRKSGGSEKKEKESIFSSIFGGKKAKAEKEMTKKQIGRGLSPEPPYRELKPDVDYSWTRFSILEERAIYRMAHIKLANPRRALYSQVLLSNFMYSYLAKVQQMHPQMNLPTSAKQQKRQQKEQQQQQPDEFTQYQRYQQQQAQQSQQQSKSNQQAQYAQHQGYEGDSSYDYSQANSRPGSRGSKQSMEGRNSTTGQQQIAGVGNAYYHQQPQNQQQEQSRFRSDDDDDDDMW